MKLFYYAFSLFLCLSLKHSIAFSSNEFEPAAPPACPGLTIVTSSDSVRCFGEKNGVARVTVTGTEPISYLWDDSNAQTTAAATGLAAGTYSVTITDGTGCFEEVSVTVEQPNTVVIAAATTPVICYGQSNGEIDLTTTGGTSPYYYSWSTNASTEDLTGLASGSYSVIVSDKKGCVAVKTVSVSQPGQLLLSALAGNVTCKGVNNGSINLIVSGGTGPFDYAWSNAETTEDLSNLGVGAYSVTVTDFNGCSNNTSANITEPQFVLNLSSVVIHPTCYNVNNGRIDLMLSGGTGPFTYDWDNGYTGEDPTAIGAGSYEVIVTDKNGCSDSITSVLTSPGQILLNSSSTNVSACGLSDGTATVAVSGGTVPYTYLWNDGLSQTTTTAGNLGAGTYSVVVKDSNNCAVSTSIDVDYTGGLSADTTVTNVTCFGNSNGQASVNASGGDGNYSYLWSNNETTATISGLSAGTYAVTVSDGNGCSYFKTAVVSQPQTLALDLDVNSSTCFGTADGSINLTSTGGTMPHTFAWSTGPITEDLSSLDTGSYSVIVTDALGCTANALAQISQPNIMTVAFAKQDVKCFSGNDGRIEISVNGGTAPFSYLWNSTDTTQNLTGITIGNYSVTVTDANGCQASNDTLINEPTELLISAVATHLECNSGGNGEINLSVSGGVPNYFYQWSNNEVTQDLVGLSGGFYDITVTDFNGCTKNLSVAVAEPDTIELTLSSTLAGCGMSDGTASVSVTGGTPSYNYSWLPSNQTSTNATGLAAGIYNIIITDANGCIKNDTVAINNPNGPTLALTGNNTKCYGSTDGSISIDLSGAAQPYTYYVVYGSDTLENISGAIAGTYTTDSLAPGTYWVSATDAAGCNTIKAVSINQPSIVTVSGSITHVVCYGGNTGAINITAAGGTSPYTYAWSNSTSAEDLADVSKGSYIVTVTDANSCQASKSFTLIETNTQISIGTKNLVLSSCPDTEDGSIEIVIAGGKAPYSILWSNNSISAVLSDVKKGIYSVTVTDSLGCTKSRTVTIDTKDDCGEVKLEKIPNAFSPNGDSYNDTWVIRNIEKFAESNVQIFNRWGNLIFNSDGYTQPWDGTHNNEPVVEGTYYYVIDLGPDQEAISGTVTVIR